ncbi:hypothetical protein EVAR_23480_1 [Eumeta japonica]|uniref:Uncharacterized protein n=1 Tax=Eumeta variegata TaxID=151549 RepID=A0A4C1UK58_EUMVA|nr:hypothetical protein EVAR_23480_1 [Eumeta japonica]
MRATRECSWSSPPMDNRKPKGVVSALPASYVELEYPMEGKWADRKESHLIEGAHFRDTAKDKRAYERLESGDHRCPRTLLRCLLGGIRISEEKRSGPLELLGTDRISDEGIDDLREGRPSAATSEDNISAVRNVIQIDKIDTSRFVQA